MNLCGEKEEEVGADRRHSVGPRLIMDDNTVHIDGAIVLRRGLKGRLAQDIWRVVDI